MTDAPERIWAQDAAPSECNFIGGGWWDDEIGSTQYPHMVEYTRADLCLTPADAEALAAYVLEVAEEFASDDPHSKITNLSPADLVRQWMESKT